MKTKKLLLIVLSLLCSLLVFASCGDDAPADKGGQPNDVPSHTHNYSSEVTEPTCTTDGYTTYTCTVCGDEYVADKVASKGHIAGETVVKNYITADCVNNGSYDNVVYCSDCSDELSREKVTVGALGHDYKSAVTAPTCTDKGYTTYTCSRCGDQYVANEKDALKQTAQDRGVSKRDIYSEYKINA